MEVCNIFGIDIAVTNINEITKLIEENLLSLKGEYICMSNVHTTVTTIENIYYKNAQGGAYLRLPDGKPLSLISLMRGFKGAERVTGPDLMTKIFELSEVKGYTHYFYGSTEETLEKLKIEILNKYPHIKIKGMYSPPFRTLLKEEDDYIIRMVNGENPDFLWIGLGAPKQEIWMYKHKGQINSLMIGIGAGIDYHAGKIKRAPCLMQKLSLEWLYRLIQDPKRLYKRYFYTNLKFIFYLLTKNKISIFKNNKLSH